MKREKISGLIAAPFTPMKGDGSIAYEIIPSYYKLLKQNNVKGVFICGSTGEGVSLSASEKYLVTEAWASCTKHDPEFKVMLLLGGTSIKECQDLAIKASELPIHSISITAPFYFKPANSQILAKVCQEIAAVAPELPFYYYHIPILTGVDISMYSLLREVDGLIPNFAGIKYTHEDFMDFQSCLSYQNGKYDMLWGRDENMLSALAVGATGAVGSTFNYAAPLYTRLIEAFQQNDLENARALQLQSIEMIRLLGKYGGIATGKAYMKLIGLNCGEFRLPVKNMNSNDYQQFVDDTSKIGFNNFCSVLTKNTSDVLTNTSA